jgi:RNA polymerase sigma-70 factor (ECF subfamily)
MVSEKEFSVIVGQTKRVVLSAVRKHLPSRFDHAIDDVVQETYIRAYRALVKGSFRNESALETWLYAIARNESIRITERLSREERKVSKMKVASGERAPDEECMSFDEVGHLVEKLPEVHRQVFRLLACGKSEKEIAGELSIPHGTVKSRIARGREEMRRLREEEGYDCI